MIVNPINALFDVPATSICCVEQGTCMWASIVELGKRHQILAPGTRKIIRASFCRPNLASHIALIYRIVPRRIDFFEVSLRPIEIVWYVIGTLPDLDKNGQGLGKQENAMGVYGEVGNLCCPKPYYGFYLQFN
jgi:hypothetical protein